MSRFRVIHVRLQILTVVWLAALGLIPWLHDQQAAFFVSVSILSVNVVVSLWTLTCRRRALLTLNVLQIILFGVLSYQLYIAFSPDHYQVDRDPEFADWLEFTLAHLCRAADVLDALDEYGIELQIVRHNSVPAGIILVAMHLAADIFLIGLLVRWLGRFWKVQKENHLVRGRRNMRWFLLALALYLCLGLVQGFRGWDWALCLLDNGVRLLDIGDLMQIFGWGLQETHSGFWTGSCGLAFRLAFGAWTADMLLWLHLAFFRGWGIILDELREILQEGDAFSRRGAARALGSCGPRAKPAVGDLTLALADFDLEVRCEAARALGMIGPKAKKAVPALALCLWSETAALRLEAARALDRIGPDASEAYPDLCLIMLLGDEPLRKIAGQTLLRFGPLPQTME